MNHHRRSAQAWHVFSRDFSFTCTPARSSAIGMSHTCLCLLSRSWYSFTDPGGMEGWVDNGAKVAKAEIRTLNLPIANPALYYTATSAPERRPQKSLCVVVVVVVVYYGHFLCYVSVCLCVFCLLTVLVKSCQYWPRLKRLFWGSLFAVRRLSPQSPG